MCRELAAGIAEARNYSNLVKLWRDPERTPYYPIHAESSSGKERYFRTLVRIQRDGKWYRVLVVERITIHGEPIHLNNGIPETVQWKAEAIQRLHMNVYNIIHLYKITGTMEDLEEDQIDEVDRLIKGNPWIRNGS